MLNCHAGVKMGSYHFAQLVAIILNIRVEQPKQTQTKKSLATWVKTLLREHYMKMKKFTYVIITL